MNRLSDAELSGLVTKFIAVCSDEARQPVIDQLGHHPVNHAKFARILAVHSVHYWLTYLDLTKAL